ncbi:serine/threonine protein kinase [Microcoleus sp. FACHB-1515]|uniref:serine/threonine protein kinase n=1 Tax=Cyanophyceae TaxID=3028117 RepID=UPI0016846E45|nr:serine/threonine-protein kinase [Microcoleus sp. FACHB-1515]MBD2090798.1 serine/threonine protein kinase [Microcoleus sp. FACHB-1515]
MLQPAQLYCINSDCRQPHQNAGNKYCQACGTPLLLRNRYLVRQKLGSGGFAMTFAVWDFQLQRDRVLKMLTETAPKAIELFEQEAQVLARLRHPGIPQVEPDSYFQVASPQRRLPCLVMEKINGQTLQDLTEQYPQGCPPEWIVDWLRQAIDILQLLHQQQIIHRDIKPSNLMLRQGSGQLVMIDFGGVKQLHSFAPTSSTRLFSPGYSPPEQSAGASVNGTADFFALGRTLIQLLTGQSPAAIEDPRTGTLHWHSYAQVSPRLASLLDDMTHPDPRRRPPSAEAIRSRLLPILDSYTRTGATAAVAIKQRRSIKLPNLGRSVLWMLRSIWWMVTAVFATLWSTVLAAIGAIVGTTIAYGMAFYTDWGTNLIAWLSQQLSDRSPSFEIAIGVDLLIFALAGWGTAWGLTAAGGLGQRRRIWSGAIGALAYSIGWFSLHRVQPEGATAGLTMFAAIAPPLLVLGLGMTRYALLRSIAAIVAIPPCIAILAAHSSATFSLWQMVTTATLDNWTFWPCLLFFGLLAVLLAACLSITHYLLVPIVDWLIHPSASRPRSRSAAHR